VDAFFKDIRYAFRSMRKNLGFYLIAVCTLGVAIAANTSVFSVVNAVLIRPLPYAEPERLTVLLHKGQNPVAPANFLDWQRQNHVFESMGAAESWSANISASDHPEKVPAQHVSTNLFDVLGVRPVIGRAFLPEEAERGHENAVVLSYGLWARLFSSDRNVVGRSVRLNGESYTVVGVMPRDFRFAPFWDTKAQLWAPLELSKRATSRNGNSLRVFARLKPGVSLASARSEMRVLSAQLESQYPGTNRDVTVLQLTEKVVGSTRPSLLVMLGAVAFVLLMACANVAHMLLARATARQKEIAVRVAIGASRLRLIRQFAVESILLGLSGGFLGVALAFAGNRAIAALMPKSLPSVQAISIDARVLLFALAIALLTGLLFGLVPVSRAVFNNVYDSLKEGAKGSSEGGRNQRLRNVLIASEFAIALILLVGAGLMVRSLFALNSVDPGFVSRNLLTMQVSVLGTAADLPTRRASFYEQALERIRAVPGVESASAINHLPLAGDVWGQSVLAEGKPLPARGEETHAVYRVVLPGYFHTMGIRLRQGRDVTQSDDLSHPQVVIVNERLARRYWPNENAVGHRLAFADADDTNPEWMTIVGVVNDVKQDGWATAPVEEVYVPLLQNRAYLENAGAPFAYLTLVVRTKNTPADLAGAIQREVWSLEPNAPVYELATMDRVVMEANAQPRFYLYLLGGFAAVALVLAAVGIYGVMSYSVSRRTREIGVRVALGAGRSDILRLVVGQGFVVTAIGAAAGLISVVPLTRLMAGLLYGVKPADPLTCCCVAGLLLAVAFVASYIPARRAARIDPIIALRHE
jgi:putative ABC transport system permease protein